MNVIEKYNAGEKALFDHVGFVPDWVVCPISDCTDMYWNTNGKVVIYAETEEKFYSDGNYYKDDIYTQRFYSKWIYEGKEFTMIFCDPHTDGVKWFRVFDNSKKLPEFNK